MGCVPQSWQSLGEEGCSRSRQWAPAVPGDGFAAGVGYQQKPPRQCRHVVSRKRGIGADRDPTPRSREGSRAALGHGGCQAPHGGDISCGKTAPRPALVDGEVGGECRLYGFTSCARLCLATCCIFAAAPAQPGQGWSEAVGHRPCAAFAFRRRRKPGSAGAAVQPWQIPAGAVGGGSHNIPTKGAWQRAGDGAGSQARGQDPIRGSLCRPPPLDAVCPACSVPGAMEAVVTSQISVPPLGASRSVPRASVWGGSRHSAAARAVLPPGPRQIPPRAWHFNVLCFWKTAF